MAERERYLTPPLGGVFVPRAQVMTADDCRRAITRIAHEIVERNHGADPDTTVLIGLQIGAGPHAHPLADTHERIGGEGRARTRTGSLDVAFYRDDIGLRPVLPEAVTDI